MLQILRKSLTAWDACPADPPTPMMNSRPPRSRKAASPFATSSMWLVSMASMTATDSLRNSLLKLTVLGLLAGAAARMSGLVVGGPVVHPGGVQNEGETEGREPERHQQQTGYREMVGQCLGPG